MARLTTYRNGICICGNDFTLEEFRDVVLPYLNKQLSYDIECIDIDGRVAFIYRVIPFNRVDEYIFNIIADRCNHSIFITPAFLIKGDTLC